MIAFTVNERPHLSPDREERNRLRDELFSIVSTIRDFAKMVFTGDLQRCCKYVFTYYRAANRKRLSRLRAAKKILLSKIDGVFKSGNGNTKSTNRLFKSTNGNINPGNSTIKTTNGIIKSNDGKHKQNGSEGENYTKT